jgi:membrane peptidoglycan carboxypeptidase
MAVVTIRLVRGVGVAALFLAAALFGIASGVLLAFVGDLPQITALDDYTPSTITRVLGRDNSVVGEFATERREVVTYAQIPEVLRNAIMAVEDADFRGHMGLQPTRPQSVPGHDWIYARPHGVGRCRRLGAEDQRSPRGAADRTAVHEG